MIKKNRSRQDSNLQSSDPKSDALSIRPHALSLKDIIVKILPLFSLERYLLNFLLACWMTVMNKERYSTFGPHLRLKLL